MNITLTQAKEPELPELLALARAASDVPDSRWDEEYPNMDILRWDLEQQGLYRAVLENGELVGMIAIHRQGEDEITWPEPYDQAWELSRLAVLPAYQLAGMGKEIFRAAVSLCRRMGCRSLRLLVSRDYARAIHIYETAGFRRIGAAAAWGESFYMYGLIL